MRKPVNTKFKVGDQVLILANLVDIESGPLGITDSMCEYANKVATITKVKEHSYTIDLDDGSWSWGDYMFEEYIVDNYITTKDFIKEVKKLKYDIINLKDVIHVYNGSQLIAVIVKDELGKVNKLLGNLMIGELLDLIIKYIMTPVEFRIAQKYQLFLDGFEDGDGYVNLTYGGELYIGSDNETVAYQTVFTEDEIANLPNQPLVALASKVPVEE